MKLDKYDQKIHNKSYESNASHDNTFNFGNELDISNGRKDKTGQMFFKQAYDFEDFQNIGDDKTVKSSNYKAKKENLSNILKKQIDQYSNQIIGNSILDNEHQLSYTGFNTKPIIENSTKKIYFDKQKYPKFGDRKQQLGDKQKNFQNGFEREISNIQKNSSNNMRTSDLSYTKSNIEVQEVVVKNQMRGGVYEEANERRGNFNKKTFAYNHKEEQDPLKKQESYKQLMSVINFYKNQTEKIKYERLLMEQQTIKEIVNMTNSQTYEEQIRNNLDSINLLNFQIQKERAIEKKLTRVVSELQQEYNQIAQSVTEMNFKRPTVIKDQSKVLIDQINQLKNQFEALLRDNGSLNLSCTLFANTPNSLQDKIGSSRNQIQKQNQQNIANQNFISSMLEQIQEQNQLSQDPQFLRNLKLACLKDEWTIYMNKQITISIDFRTCPIIRLRIGNKTSQLLKRFTIQIEVRDTKVKLMQNEVIEKKSFIIEGLKIDPENLSQVFIKIFLSYQIQHQNLNTKQSKKIRLFCPTGILNFGEFAPLTLKEFQTQLNLPLPSIQSPFKPIDKKLINSIDEIMLYFPNLNKWQNQSQKIFGLFMSVFNQGTLVLIQTYNDLLKIRLKNGNRSLLKLLQFILTV